MLSGPSRDVELGDGRKRPIRVLLWRMREWIEKHPRTRFGYRFFVSVFGSAIIIVGLILVPLPGPGWLIVFVGLEILATEIPAARRLSNALKRLLAAAWARAQRRRARRHQKRTGHSDGELSPMPIA